MRKVEFALNHNKDDKNEVWKNDVVDMLLSKKMLPYFKGFFEGDEDIAAYIVAPRKVFKKFLKDSNLQVDQVVKGIKFLKGKCEF